MKCQIDTLANIGIIIGFGAATIEDLYPATSSYPMIVAGAYCLWLLVVVVRVNIRRDKCRRG